MNFLSVLLTIIITFLITYSNACMKTIPPDEAYITSTEAPEDTTPGSPATSEPTTPAGPNDPEGTTPGSPATSEATSEPTSEPTTPVALPLCQLCDVKSVIEDPAPGDAAPTTWTETDPTNEGCIQYKAVFQAPAGQACTPLRIFAVLGDNSQTTLIFAPTESYETLTLKCLDDKTWGYQGAISGIKKLFWTVTPNCM